MRRCKFFWIFLTIFNSFLEDVPEHGLFVGPDVFLVSITSDTTGIMVLAFLWKRYRKKQSFIVI